MKFFSVVCEHGKAGQVDQVAIRAKCFRSMRKNDKPHEVQILILRYNCNIYKKMGFAFLYCYSE